MGRRDGNGKMQDGLVDIVWAPIITTPPPTPRPSTGTTPTPTPSTTPNSTPPLIPTGATPPQIPIQGEQAVAKEPELATRPCEELRRRLRELKANNRERLERLRGTPGVVTDPGAWLQDLDTVPGIATVALAVTAHQNWRQGFSIPSAQDVVSCTMRVIHPSAGVSAPAPVIRFCRPMMFPVYHNQHTVLALVQMDQAGELSFSIFDSMSSYYDMGDKNTIIEIVTRTVQDTLWWRQRYHDWDTVPKPVTSQWIPCAQQPTENECGYYSMIFSWALVLGLELNPHAAPIWDEPMFQEVLDVSHLARLGVVDWTLIQNFLRCHRFVLDGAVPYNRRFQFSVPLESVNALVTHLGGLAEEEQYVPLRPDFDIAIIISSNFIRLPTGLDIADPKFIRPPTAPKESEEWERDRSLRHQLMLLGHLRFGIPPVKLNLLKRYHLIPSEQRIVDARDFGTHEAFYFQMLLRWSERTSEYHEIPHERWFTWYRLFLANERAQTGIRPQLDNEPCVLAAEKLQRLRQLFANNHINQNLANAIPDANPGLTLDLGEINLAIAAVVEAIDQRQASLHRGDRNTFAGGFALATSGGIEIAKAMPAAGAVSRPRRCLFLPILITSDEIAHAEKKEPPQPSRAHNFLAVVQEEPRTRVAWNNDSSHFVVYTLDSAPDRFKNSAVQTLFYNRVRDIATNLGWHEQRNDHQARFRRQHTQVDVFRQGRNAWQCGLHVILNSWILALGLLPTADQVIVDEQFYNDLWLLIRSATAGLLDWQTLVAWLFCKGVTTLRTLDAVPEDRRFELSRHQDARFGTSMGQRVFIEEGDLVNRVQEMSDHDMMNVAFQTEEALPYERGNNIVIPGQSSSWESSNAKQGDPTKQTGGRETKMTIDDLRFEPGSREYRTAQLCTEEQLEILLAGMAGVETDRDTTFIGLAMSMGIEEADKGLEEGSNEGSNGESVVGSNVGSEELDRAFDNCGVPRRGGLKRKADVKSEGSRHDGSFSTSRKRCKLSCSSSRQVLRSCVDADGDVRMG